MKNQSKIIQTVIQTQFHACHILQSKMSTVVELNEEFYLQKCNYNIQHLQFALRRFDCCRNSSAIDSFDSFRNNAKSLAFDFTFIKTFNFLFLFFLKKKLEITYCCNNIIQRVIHFHSIQKDRKNIHRREKLKLKRKKIRRIVVDRAKYVIESILQCVRSHCACDVHRNERRHHQRHAMLYRWSILILIGRCEFYINQLFYLENHISGIVKLCINKRNKFRQIANSCCRTLFQKNKKQKQTQTQNPKFFRFCFCVLVIRIRNRHQLPVVVASHFSATTKLATCHMQDYYF